MLCGDLSQIELAILAYYLELLCRDSAMAEGNRAGRDAHDVNTTNWYGVSKEFDPVAFSQKRPMAKNGIFAAGYGAREERLSLTLNISRAEAREILNTVAATTEINQLKAIFWGQARRSRDVRKVGGKTTGFFYDCLGSRGFYPQLTSHDKGERESAERQSFNALMQRGCSTIMQRLMNELLPTVASSGGWYAASVHDEVLVYVPTANASQVLAEANRVFNSLTLPTPQGGIYVRADFHAVQSWADK